MSISPNNLTGWSSQIFATVSAMDLPMGEVVKEHPSVLNWYGRMPVTLDWMMPLVGKKVVDLMVGSVWARIPVNS